MISPIHSIPARTAHPARANPNSNLNHLIGLSFSVPKNPEQKGFLQKKIVPVIRRVGAVAGRVSDVAGKVAVVASIL